VVCLRSYDPGEYNAEAEALSFDIDLNEIPGEQMLFNLPLDQIDATVLERLKTDSVREDRQLEYKEMLPGGSDEEKREFLSDVTAFANAAGGDLIYGVRERREEGTPTSTIDSIVGLSQLNVDTVRLRLQSLIQDGVAPRMQPITFHEIRRDPELPCLLLRVPRSSFGLHMITFRNYSRFYGRTSAGKYQLDVQEIRAGFIAAETAVERLRRLRMERVARVLALETPAPITDGPKLVLHAFPVNVLNEVWARMLSKQ
jgi:hypothetical protein